MEKLAERFKVLSDVFDSETMFLSSESEIVGCWSYQEVINMGWDVVPLLIEDMVNNRRPWFHALCKITGANPVKIEHQGDVTKIIDDWVDWYKERTQ